MKSGATSKKLPVTPEGWEALITEAPGKAPARAQEKCGFGEERKQGQPGSQRGSTKKSLIVSSAQPEGRQVNFGDAEHQGLLDLVRYMVARRSVRTVAAFSRHPDPQ